MKKIIAILAMQAALLATPLAHAQDEGSAEVEASGSVSAEGSASTGSASADASSGYVDAEYGELGHSAFGIGAKVTLLGLPAAEIAFHLSPKLMLTGLIAFVTFTPEGEGAESQTAFVLGAGGFFNLFHHGIGDFMMGGRFMFASADDTNTGGMNLTATQIDIEFPARAQLQINHHLAVHFEVGLAISIAGDDGGVTTPGGATRFVLGAGDVFGTAGFTVYF